MIFEGVDFDIKYINILVFLKKKKKSWIFSHQKMCLLRQVRGAGANNSVTMMPIFMDENTRWQMVISICQLCYVDDTINIPLWPILEHNKS